MRWLFCGRAVEPDNTAVITASFLRQRERPERRRVQQRQRPGQQERQRHRRQERRPVQQQRRQQERRREPVRAQQQERGQQPERVLAGPEPCLKALDCWEAFPALHWRCK